MQRYGLLALLIATLAIGAGCAGDDGLGNPATGAPSVATAAPPAAGSPAGSVSPDIAQLEREVHDGINERRRDNGLEPLEYREDLARVARDYSELMLERDFFAHTGPDGDTVEDRVRASNITYTAVGENLFKATGAPNPGEMAVQGWMDSSGHRENILRDRFTHTGIGVANDGDTFYVTQVFMTP